MATDREIESSDNQWRGWPEEFGKPSGKPEFHRDGGIRWHAHRAFANGEVTVVNTTAGWFDVHGFRAAASALRAPGIVAVGAGFPAPPLTCCFARCGDRI